MAAACAAMMLFGGSASAKTLIYCSEGSPEGFDPAPYSAGTTFDASSKPIYNRLVEFERGETNVIPALAERWEVSDDGLEYTLFLRKGVKFHKTPYFTPTREFNADDVIFSFERQRDKSAPWHQYMPGLSYEYFDSMEMGALIKEIVKVDDHTVKFVLNRPEAPFLANIAMDYASIMSKEYADKLEAEGHREKLNTAPVGTGPFIFVNYQKDAVVRFKVNPDYWRGRQALDNLVFAITTDASVRLQKLKAGECHLAPYPSPADIAGLKADPKIKMDEQAGLNVAYLAPNALTPPFDKPEVRRAIEHAINKQAIIDAVFQGFGQVAKNPIPPTMWSYNNAVQDNTYDPELARKMLDDAGVKNLKTKIWAMPVSRPHMPNSRRAAELIQADLKKVGVDADIVSMEWGEYLKKSGETDRDGMVMLGWVGDNGDPDNFLGTLLSCAGVGSQNRAQWCNKEFDALTQKARTLSNKEERTKLYEEAQILFKQQAPWTTLAHSTAYQPMSIKVIGYKMDPLGSHRFDGVDLAP
ncbi:ABC transporter substrate-binding protein [Pseudochelatococcus sp. G4_1912]